MDDTQTDAIYETRLELLDFVVAVFADAPDREFVAELLDGDVELPDDEVEPALDRGFQNVERFRERHAEESLDEVVDHLETEYTRVFVGPRPLVLPHETYYREDTDFIGEGLATVEESYAAAGWKPPEDYGEENDHVAVEATFLRNLVRRQFDGERPAVGFERVFIDEHLREWIDDFRDDVYEETDEPLFRAGADVLLGAVDFEEELVSQLA